jgi:hypothetical protein
MIFVMIFLKKDQLLNTKFVLVHIEKWNKGSHFPKERLGGMNP